MRLISTISILDNGETWLFHCVNGHDRTGLAIGNVRVMVDGWTKKQAWKEMLDRGYHPELIGLNRQWSKLQRSPASAQ